MEHQIKKIIIIKINKLYYHYNLKNNDRITLNSVHVFDFSYTIIRKNSFIRILISFSHFCNLKYFENMLFLNILQHFVDLNKYLKSLLY